MEDFNASFKNIDTKDAVLSSKIFIAKNHKLAVNVNGALKSFTIKNLPANYTAYTGIYGKEIHNVEGKKVYARFYMKILDPFGREVNDFRFNHHLHNGLDIEFTANNTQNNKIKVVNIGVYEPVNNVYSLKVFNDNPIEIKEVSQETKATNSSATSDGSTWFVIGGIVAAVIILLLIIWWFYGGKTTPVISTTITPPPPMVMVKQIERVNTRFLY